ncbi:hypothetical protein FOA43_001612 [Brettanomyces nanus]|uniref:Uncharacterized protein n=1 Tax=Eeniella nana TaxID=13502 RepID=A0A875RU83_EENNA|nr:uncharacterized protein FOA43_001612 [Brettanomyces nanus]QPG74287.1 hypothetical protein FOA43_001612 [Brettanomyces nanus]
MTVKTFLHDTWEVLKIPDTKTFKTEYINPNIDRERKQRKVVNGIRKNSFLQAFNLYPSYYSAYERKFLLKFDVSVLLFLGASFYTKYLDNTNIGSAYVSGMQQDINITGNELNYFNTMYTIGYALFQIPITLLVTKPQFSRYLLITCELIWGVLTLSNGFVHNSQQVYVIRFFIGVSEACSFPATYVIFSSFLTDEELFTRAGIYGAFAVAGSASSGVLQTRARESLSGVCGLEGWRWQFIIDGLITFGVVLYGLFLFPGIPTACKKFGLFTEDDMIFARKRMDKKLAVPQKFTKKSIKETLTTWQFYVCTLMWTFHHSSYYSNGNKLYMKSKPNLYTTSQVTNWDTYMYLLGIPMATFISPLTEWISKLIVVNVVMVTAYYACAVLVVWNVPNSLLISAFFVQRVFIDGLSQVFFAWSATLCKDNVEKKALVLGFMQAFSYATNAWVIPIQYNIKDSPRFRSGYIANIVIVLMTNVMFMICWVLAHYDKKLIPRFAGTRHLNTRGNIRTFDQDEYGDERASDTSKGVVTETVRILEKDEV